MAVYNLKTPLCEKEIRVLRVNDIVFLSGTVITARDQAHKRALKVDEEGKTLLPSFKDLALFHCGPIMKKVGSKWFVVAAGPTTSTRLEAYEDQFIAKFGPRMIIGKGGMKERTGKALSDFGAVYCSFTGGAAVLAAQSVLKVVGVEMFDLGMPEAMWIFEVRDFGPLIVSLDSHGNNLFQDVKSRAEIFRDKIFNNLKL